MAFAIGPDVGLRSVGGRQLPVGHDAFYHAARIQGAVRSGRVAPFDPRMHAPQGHWVTWPCAYPAAIAAFVRVTTGVTGSDPETVTAYVPVLLGIAAVWLVVGITALLGLGPSWAAVLSRVSRSSTTAQK